jgi:hypothetical protein
MGMVTRVIIIYAYEDTQLLSHKLADGGGGGGGRIWSISDLIFDFWIFWDFGKDLLAMVGLSKALIR